MAPSKVIGYEGMDAETYRRERSTTLDGRATEKALERRSRRPIRTSRQAPNTLARIAIVCIDGAPARMAMPDELVNLLAAVYRRLPATQQSAFRRVAMTE